MVEVHCQPESLDDLVEWRCPPVLNKRRIPGLLHKREINFGFIQITVFWDFFYYSSLTYTFPRSSDG